MILQEILERRLLIIAGKGGAGKTTIAAAMGVLAARHSLRVLIAEVEGKGSLSSMLGADALGSEPLELRPDLFAMNISPEEALEEYFDVQLHMRVIAKPLVSSQLVYYVTHAAPGLRDILILGKLWYAATRRKDFDLIVLDTPAAGHAVSMLRSPEGFLHAVPVGPLAGHTRDVLGWLRDPTQVSIHLVCTPEEMSVNETVETTLLMEDRLHMDVTTIFLNMLYPPQAEDPQMTSAIEAITHAGQIEEAATSAGYSLRSEDSTALFDAANFYSARRTLQQSHRSTLAAQLRRTAQIIDVPFLFREAIGGKEVDVLADEIEAQVNR